MTGPARAAVLEQVADVVLGGELGHPTRVAVDGVTAAGKTTFADELAIAVAARGQTVQRLSMDGFHHRRARRHRQGRLSADGYYADAYDFARTAQEMLVPLGGAGPWRYRPRLLDLGTDEPIDEWHDAPAEAVIVVDGTFLQRPELRTHWDHVVYLDVDFATALARAVPRDSAALGGPDATREAYELRYHAACRRYLDEVDPLSLADVVVDNRDFQQPVLRRSGREDRG